MKKGKVWGERLKRFRKRISSFAVKSLFLRQGNLRIPEVEEQMNFFNLRNLRNLRILFGSGLSGLGLTDTQLSLLKTLGTVAYNDRMICEKFGTTIAESNQQRK